MLPFLHLKLETSMIVDTLTLNNARNIPNKLPQLLFHTPNRSLNNDVEFLNFVFFFKFSSLIGK